jgi:hypothetical protein
MLGFEKANKIFANEKKEAPEIFIQEQQQQQQQQQQQHFFFKHSLKYP